MVSYPTFRGNVNPILLQLIRFRAPIGKKLELTVSLSLMLYVVYLLVFIDIVVLFLYNLITKTHLSL